MPIVKIFSSITKLERSQIYIYKSLDDARRSKNHFRPKFPIKNGAKINN